mmetsp:Transcript_4881/g.5961  ORF Transcript_4881/g.5961 Transcript_4881/m.5961 type:complete len:228 (+) Transcript_4881:291-974(+)
MVFGLTLRDQLSTSNLLRPLIFAPLARQSPPTIILVKENNKLALIFLVAISIFSLEMTCRPPIFVGDVQSLLVLGPRINLHIVIRFIEFATTFSGVNSENTFPAPFWSILYAVVNDKLVVIIVFNGHPTFHVWVVSIFITGLDFCIKWFLIRVFFLLLPLAIYPPTAIQFFWGVHIFRFPFERGTITATTRTIIVNDDSACSNRRTSCIIAVTSSKYDKRRECQKRR